MIKNLISLAMSEPLATPFSELQKRFSAMEFVPCGNSSFSAGFGKFPESEDFINKVGDFYAFYVITEKKVVPAHVIKLAVEEKAKEHEEREGRKPSKSELKDIKENVIAVLTPQAFPKRTQVLSFIDVKRHRLNVDTSSSKTVDEVVSFLRHAIPDLPGLSLIHTEKSPQTAMSGWLVDDAEIQGTFTVDDKAELVLPVEGKPTIKFSHDSLDTEKVKSYIAEGRVVVSLALTHKDMLSFALTDKLIIKGVKSQVKPDNEQDDSEAVKWDATFLLFAEALSDLMDDLIDALGGVAAHQKSEGAESDEYQEHALAA